MSGLWMDIVRIDRAGSPGIFSGANHSDNALSLATGSSLALFNA